MEARRTERELRQRAIGKALAMGGAATVTRIKYGSYLVESATRVGVAHRVSQDAGGRLHCGCEAGLQERVCWHAAAVFIAKVEAGGGRVTGPASAPAAAELPANVTPLRRAA